MTPRRRPRARWTRPVCRSPGATSTRDDRSAGDNRLISRDGHRVEMVVGASNGRCFFPRTSAGFLESAHRGGGEVNRTCGVYHRVVHSLIRLAFPMIVSFRDGWLRAFFVEDRRSRNIPSDLEARLFREKLRACISTITAIGEVLPW